MLRSALLPLAGLFALSTTTAFAQMDDRPGAAFGGSDQGPAAMREMMREMMEEMMRRAPLDEEADEIPTEPPPERDEGRAAGTKETTESRGELRRPERRRYFDHDGMGPRRMMRQSRHAAQAKILFAIVDANGDGSLTIDEVNDFHQRIFNAVDQDRNGSVTLAEVQNFFHGSRDVQGD